MLKKEKRYDRARHCLMVMAVFSAVNVVLTLIGSEKYFLFSGFAVYIQAVFCRTAYEATGNVGHLAIGAVSAALVIALYVLCWIMSRGKRGWLLAGLTLVVLDAVALLYCCMAFAAWNDFLLDLVFHALILLEMVVGAASVSEEPLFEKKREPIDTWNRRRKF